MLEHFLQMRGRLSPSFRTQKEKSHVERELPAPLVGWYETGISYLKKKLIDGLFKFSIETFFNFGFLRGVIGI